MKVLHHAVLEKKLEELQASRTGRPSRTQGRERGRQRTQASKNLWVVLVAPYQQLRNGAESLHHVILVPVRLLQQRVQPPAVECDRGAVAAPSTRYARGPPSSVSDDMSRSCRGSRWSGAVPARPQASLSRAHGISARVRRVPRAPERISQHHHSLELLQREPGVLPALHRRRAARRTPALPRPATPGATPGMQAPADPPKPRVRCEEGLYSLFATLSVLGSTGVWRLAKLVARRDVHMRNLSRIQAAHCTLRDRETWLPDVKPV